MKRSNVIALDARRKPEGKREERKPVSLTDSFARTAALPADGEPDFILYRDIKQPAFCLRVTRNGNRAWCVNKWANGRVNRIAMPSIADLSANEARKRAQKLIAKLHDGIDPHEERRQEQGAATTLADGIASYIEKNHLAPRTKSDYEGLSENELAPWANLKLTAIDREKAREIHAKIEGDTRADYALRLLRAVVLANELPNPCAKLAGRRFPWRNKNGSHKPRLEAPMAGKAWRVFGSLPNKVAGAQFRTLMVTGMRPEEGSSMTVDMISLPAKRIDLPMTKNGQAHRVYIAPELERVLKPLLKGKEPSELVFHGCADPRKSLEAAIVKLGVTFSRKDLRKLMGGIARKCRVEHPVVKAMLNHSMKTGDVTSRHYVPATEEEIRDAFMRVAKFAAGART